MRFEVENKPHLDGVTEKQIRSAVSKLRGYGPSSFASITAPDGSYLQVGGGGITCTLERRDADTKRHFRAHSLQPTRIHPDGTILAFGRGQEIRMMSDEWLTVDLVADAFCCFLKREALPGILGWREITDLLS
jgi:hypothetical protein